MYRNRSWRRNGPLDDLPSWTPWAFGAAAIALPIIVSLARQKRAMAATTSAVEGTLGGPENASMQAKFGPLMFVPAPVANNPEAIQITNGWDRDNIVSVPLPEMGRTVQFHKKCAGKLQQLISAWASAGILGDIVTWDGTFVPRFIRGSKTKLSPHTWGNAFDINAAYNPFHQPVAGPGEYGNVWRLAEIAKSLGWTWGGDWGAYVDGMHFQIDNC
jgi:hypothetical protein